MNDIIACSAASRRHTQGQDGKIELKPWKNLIRSWEIEKNEIIIIIIVLNTKTNLKSSEYLFPHVVCVIIKSRWREKWSS